VYVARISVRRRSRGVQPFPSVVAMAGGTAVPYSSLNTAITSPGTPSSKITVFHDSATSPRVFAAAIPCEEHL
jgi:hypothetical protein